MRVVGAGDFDTPPVDDDDDDYKSLASDNTFQHGEHPREGPERDARERGTQEDDGCCEMLGSANGTCDWRRRGRVHSLGARVGIASEQGITTAAAAASLSRHLSSLLSLSGRVSGRACMMQQC